MSREMTSIRLGKQLTDKAALKSRTKAVHIALREVVALKWFKKLMKKHSGKLPFAGYGG